MLRSLIVNTLLALGSLLTSLLVLELSLRALDISSPDFYQPDPVTGYSLRPHAEGIFGEEGQAFVRINSKGLRAAEYNVDKAKGVFRIAVLGDSFAEAGQVTADQAFWSLMEQGLKSCAAKHHFVDVEVINFGVGGYGTAQQLLKWRASAIDYAPDLVLLMHFPGNDIRNNVRSLEQDELRPYMIIRNNELVVDSSFTETEGFQWRVSPVGQLLYEARAELRTLQLISRGLRLMRKLKGAQQRQEISGIKHFLVGLDSEIMLPPATPDYAQGWKVTERTLQQLHGEVVLSGANFLAVVIPDQLQVIPDTQLREEFREFLGVDDLYYPNRRLQFLAVQQGIPLLDLTPDMLLHGGDTGEYLYGFDEDRPGLGHWNPKGHAFVSALLESEICTRWMQ